MIVVGVIFLALVAVGPRLPWIGLVLPIGVALIAYAVATTPGRGDGAVLYTMPVLWMTFFYGWRRAVAILGGVGVGHALALVTLPASSVYPGRWVDVMVSVTGTAIVVLTLEGRHKSLLTCLGAEARTDPLTGLLNRRGLDERAEVEIARAPGQHAAGGGQLRTSIISGTSTTSGVMRPATGRRSGSAGC